MPSYVASGADAKTGQDRTITFEADDDAQAAAVAKARGVFVSRVERRPAPPTVEYQPALSSASTVSGEHEEKRGTEQQALPLRNVAWWAVAIFKAALVISLIIPCLDNINLADQQAAIKETELAASSNARAGVYAVLVVAALLVPMPSRKVT